jgi:hypothetical protein
VPNFDVVVVNQTGLWGKIFCFHTSEPTATATNLWPLIVQDKQKETYTVDLVLVVEEKHTIECPTLMLWLLIRQACGAKSFVFTHQNPQQRLQTSDHCPRQTKGNIYGGFSPGS